MTFRILKSRGGFPTGQIDVYYSSIFDPKMLSKRYWPYQYTLTDSTATEVERWCYLRFKSRNWRNQGRYFAFKQEKDFTMFILRWS
jgi:hypothetical protein